jgi:hypothetical protein
MPISLQELQKQGEINIVSSDNKTSAPKSGIVDKVLNAGQKASNFLFGSTGKMVGSLLGSAVESAKQLATGKNEEGAFITKEGTPKVFLNEGQLRNRGSVATDIAFTGLELMPGGMELTKTLSKIPGGAKVIDGIVNAFKSVPNHLKEDAIKQYASIFRATSKESKGLVEKVVPNLLDNKQVITSADSLAEKAGQKLAPIGEKINKVIDNIPDDKKVDISETINRLEQMKSKYIVSGKVIDNTKVNAIENVKNTLSQFGDKIPAQDFIQIRRILDESIDEAGGFIADKATKFIAKVEKTAAGSMRNELAKEIPDLNVLNPQYSFWSNVKKLASNTAKKSSPILRRTAGSGVGGTIGALQGDSLESRITGAALGALLGNKAIEFIQSPAWKSVSAITKSELADYLAKGDIKKSGEVIRRLITTTKNYGENNSQGN